MMVSVIVGWLSMLFIFGLLVLYAVVRFRACEKEVKALIQELSALSAPPVSTEEKTEKKPDPMDEGFENIMAFAVMGKTGFRDGEEP